MIGRIEYQTKDAVATEHVVTLPAPGSGQHWVVLGLEVIFDGSPPTADIVFVGLDAPTVVPILSGNSDKQFVAGGSFFLGKDDTAVVITIPAGGGGVRSLVYMTAVKLLTANIERLYFQS